MGGFLPAYADDHILPFGDLKQAFVNPASKCMVGGGTGLGWVALEPGELSVKGDPTRPVGRTLQPITAGCQ